MAQRQQRTDQEAALRTVAGAEELGIAVEQLQAFGGGGKAQAPGHPGRGGRCGGGTSGAGGGAWCGGGAGTVVLDLEQQAAVLLAGPHGDGAAAGALGAAMADGVLDGRLQQQRRDQEGGG